MNTEPLVGEATQTGKFLDALFDTTSNDISYLKGRVLTVIDAITDDKERREAIKDLIHQAFADYSNNRFYPLNNEIYKKIRILAGEIEEDNRNGNAYPDALPRIK